MFRASATTVRAEPSTIRRIVVLGTTGSGKSTLARRIAALLDCPLVELDDLNWLPGWRMRPEQEFLAAVDAAVARPAWVVAGNYRRTWPLSLQRADLVIWLDCGFWRTLGRLIRRSLRRAWTRETICNGNVETFRRLLAHDSILVWFFRTYAANRRRFAALLADPRCRRLRTDADIAALLAVIAAQGAADSASPSSARRMEAELERRHQLR